MQPARESQPVRLAGRTLRENRHICAFFRSAEERNALLMPFFKEGFDRGEKVYHIIDGEEHDSHICECQNWGIDTEKGIESGQLEVRHWEDAYLQDGYFDGDRMVGVLKDILESNRESYGLTRLMGNMEWALESLPGVNGIVEYETKLNYVIPNYPDPIICAYDLNRHSGSVIMDILRTHPMVIIGGVLQENPMYVPPDEMLRELEQRQSQSAAGH